MFKGYRCSNPKCKKGRKVLTNIPSTACCEFCGGREWDVLLFAGNKPPEPKLPPRRLVKNDTPKKPTLATKKKPRKLNQKRSNAKHYV